jgi:4-hydroxybenzoate polyprenyltransferase
VWPLIFCSGLVLAFSNYGSFSWALTVKAILIAVLGFEAGFVLNDYVDKDIDKKDVDKKLTKYWRPFHERPIPSGFIPAKHALILFFVLVFLAVALTITVPYPHNVYVIGIGVYCYTMEYFYQTKKRNQSFPWAQLLGRTDFTVFPVAGYVLYGFFDTTIFLYILFFYPFVMAHLGVNDMADVINDRARGLKTIPVLYGMDGAAKWVVLFIGLHLVLTPFFLREVEPITVYGFFIAWVLLLIAGYKIMKEKSAAVALKVLPFFHVSMLVYTVSIIIGYAVTIL